MNDIDYEELIRSPLDGLDDDPVSPWLIAGVGVMVGVAVGYLMTILIGSDTTTTTTPSPSVTAIAAPAVVTAPDYPEGYLELAPDLGARVEEVIVADDVITVGFAAAVSRGADPAATPWPRGGSWQLEAASGTTVDSARVIVGGFSPGAFSVQFPASDFNGEEEFNSIRLVDRWDTKQFSGSTSLPFTGEPLAIDEALSLPVSQDVTLLLTQLALGRFQGLIEWEITGADLGATVDAVVRLRDDDDAEVGSYAAFPQVLPPDIDGVIDVNWQQSFPIDQEGAVTMVVEYTVDVVQSVPVSIEFPLTDVVTG